MTTKLDHELKREITVAGVAYTLSISGEMLRLTEKGRRKGLALTWKDLLSGDAGLAAALQASLSAVPAPRKTKVARAKAAGTGIRNLPKPRAKSEQRG